MKLLLLLKSEHLMTFLRCKGLGEWRFDCNSSVSLWIISILAPRVRSTTFRRICIPSSYNRNGCTIYPPYPYYYYPQLKGLYDVVRLLLSEWQMKMLCVFLIRYHHSFFFTEFGLTVLYGGDFTHTQTWQYFAH